MSMTQHRTMKSVEFPEFPRLHIRTGRLEIRWQDTLKPQIEFRKKTLIAQAPEEHWNWSLFHPFPFWRINLAILDTDFFPKQDVFLRLKRTGSYLDGWVGRRRIFSLFCRRDRAPESRRNPEFSLSRTIFSVFRRTDCSLWKSLCCVLFVSFFSDWMARILCKYLIFFHSCKKVIGQCLSDLSIVYAAWQ